MSDGRRSAAPQTKQLYWFGWMIGTLVQVLICLPWVWKRIHWRALAMASAVFVPIMFITENLALHWGWWVWTDDKLLGPKVLLVPLEEFLLYFLIVPSLVAIQILLQKCIESWTGRRS